MECKCDAPVAQMLAALLSGKGSAQAESESIVTSIPAARHSQSRGSSLFLEE